MYPDELNNSQGGVPPLSKQGINQNDSDQKNLEKNREAAANLIRSQIDDLFEKQNNIDDQLEAGNPYEKTHTKTSNQSYVTNDWQHYHSAWQNYYQKYYSNYYHRQYQRAANPAGHYFNQKENQNTNNQEIFNTNEAVFDLRQKLLSQVTDSAKKIRKSRHFWPILTGLSVILIFLFLQYNRLIFSNIIAYVSPGNIDPQNIVIDPNSNINVGPEPRLIIPKINVDVPVLYGVGNDYASQMKAMEKGVAQFAIPGANSRPGQIGNTVLSGHSSNDLFDTGDYKFIFAQLDKLQKGDTIYLNYKSKRYTYVVTKKEVVKPNQVDKLIVNTKIPILTLITCTPLGTALNRLLVTAEQISPDPSTAIAETKDQADTKAEMPGDTPSFLEKLFGKRY
ncbi:MAG: sortase [Candidatus Saccharimonadales bacterium]